MMIMMQIDMDVSIISIKNRTWQICMVEFVFFIVSKMLLLEAVAFIPFSLFGTKWKIERNQGGNVSF